MGRPTQATVRRLFAVSGNRCCHPECQSPVIAADGTVLGEICHIRARNEGGPRFHADQTEAERQSFGNLVLLCRNHHRMVDAQVEIYTVDILLEMKARHESLHARSATREDDAPARQLLDATPRIEVHGNTGTFVVGGEGAVIADVVHIRSTGCTTKILPPSGTIGSAAAELRYVEYLIKLYNDYASREPSRAGKFSHGAIRANIATRYGARVQLLAIDLFAELCDYLQQRISRTRIAKTNRSRGHRSFSSFAEHQMKRGGE